MTEHHEHEIGHLREARDRILGRIADACAHTGREPSAVTLVAVSKNVTAERLRAAVAAGLATLGENRVQEAEGKVSEVPGASWHLVGPLQSNKARRALAIFDVIEAVDSVALAERLDRLVREERPGRRLPVLLQVNVDRDQAKAGFAPDAIGDSLDQILALPGLDVCGLMTMGRLTAEPTEARSTFSGLRELSDRLRAGTRNLGAELSMGMSDDFELAVEEGATVVRVGRALFGERPHEH